jgi:hypothetical protein
MAGHKELEDESSQEDCTKTRRPFKIDEVLGPVTYQLKLPESWKIQNVFHAALLRPYIKNKSMGIITPGHYPSCWKAKKSMKSKQSSDIGEEEKDINTM